MKFSAPAGLLCAAIDRSTTTTRGFKVETGASAAQRAASANRHALKLDADGDMVTASCFDGLVSIAASVPAMVDVSGSFATHAGRALALVAGFPDQTMIHFDNGAITADSGRYKLPDMPVDRLPMSFKLDGEIASIEISLPAMQGLLDTLGAVNKEETRHYLNGTFWHSADGNLIAVSCDGNRLIKVVADASPSFSEDWHLIVPRDSINVLKKLITPAKPRSLLLRRNKRLLSVGCEAFTLITLLIDGAFPAYERLIPPATANAVVVDRVALSAALARLAATANRPAPIVAGIWAPGEFKVYLAQEPDAGTDVIKVISTTSGRFAVPLRQLNGLVAEMAGALLSIDANGPIMIQAVDSPRKVAVCSQCEWSWTC